MVPWRATDDGFVTARRPRLVRRASPRASPGVLVVEATGIRDVPCGPAPAHRHDRFVAGPAAPRRDRARAQRGARRGSSSSSSTSSRSAAARERDKFFARFLADRRAPPRRRWSRRSATTRWPSTRPDAERARAARGARRRALAEAALTRASSRSSSCGYRERVTDIAPAAHPRAAAGPAGALRRRGRARARGRLRRRRAALRARVHDGVVPLGAEHARRTATAARASTACGCRSRSSRRCARASAPSACVGCRYPRRRRDRGRQPTSTTRPGSASSFARPGSTSCRSRRAASSRTPSSRRSARRSYPYTGRVGLRVHADHATPTRAARSAATCRSRPRSARAVRAAGLTTPVVAARRHLRLRAGRGHPRARRGRLVAPARQTSPIPTGSGRSALGRGAEVRRCEFTNYCEGARPAAQAGDLQAVGPRASIRTIPT